ncbi:hypothetical protein [Pluralibacter sp.]|jgi:hypothetical protein|uniref:hypothetical protein n=1 Tax=Pluralibacter sp. TaxID=1920032 RepID=UPI0025EAF42C|nr:hypothetical protein [Pluralibacter sp.]MBV8045048.1 hypothetical protein [Pluralibacter sp.]
MTRYANIQFKDSKEFIRTVLIINGFEIPVSGRNGKWFTNLPVSDTDQVYLSGNDDKVNLVFSDEKMFHPDQIAFDKKYNIQCFSSIGGNVYYSLSGELVNPRKCLVTFPGVSNFDNVNYRLSAMTSLQSRLQGILILAFQDRESVYGNYMHETSSGAPVRNIVAKFIGELCLKYNLKPRDIIFYGNSKGGSIAIDYISEFPDSRFFIDIPQMELFNYKSQNALMRYSLGTKARKYYNYIEYLPSMRNRNVTYSFAERDFDASRGLPMKEFSGINVAMIKDMEHSGSAMELVKRQFTKVIQLAGTCPVLEKKAIDMRMVYSEGMLYASRLLGAFKDEKQLSKVYAEIEFIGNGSSYSISLNKKMNRVLFIYWRYGFDALKHLPAGEYQLALHIYYDFREFVYPINNIVHISKNDVVVSKRC